MKGQNQHVIPALSASLPSLWLCQSLLIPYNVHGIGIVFYSKYSKKAFSTFLKHYNLSILLTVLCRCSFAVTQWRLDSR